MTRGSLQFFLLVDDFFEKERKYLQTRDAADLEALKTARGKVKEKLSVGKRHLLEEMKRNKSVRTLVDELGLMI